MSENSKIEHPILFNSEMVRAILGGRKTQTRRVVKPQPMLSNIRLGEKTLAARHALELKWLAKNKCPYGVPGDKLWVRETFRHFGNVSNSGITKAYIEYKADGETLKRGKWEEKAPIKSWWNTGKTPWSPSIHMPRWASRITLEVTGVRVERVQDIRDADAIAEGIDPKEVAARGWVDARVGFRDLWDSINAKYPWESNPWVWIVEFRNV